MLESHVERRCPGEVIQRTVSTTALTLKLQFMGEVLIRFIMSCTCSSRVGVEVGSVSTPSSVVFDSRSQVQGL
jgi:hypothetical protein